MGKSRSDTDAEIETKIYKVRYLQIFKDGKYYLLDRTKYDQNCIMMLLDLKKLNKLGEQFREYDDGVEKTEFIRLVKKELGIEMADPIEETSLVYGLHKLFCEIDFNGDGHMQWEEFTQFIIDMVECEAQAFLDENEEEDMATKQFNEKAMQKYKRYKLSPFIRDKHKHKTPIIDAAFIPKNDMLFICEYRSKIMKIYNPLNGKVTNVIDIDKLYDANAITKNVKIVKNEFKATSTYSVVAICVHNWLVGVCLSNQTILFFSLSSYGKSELLYQINTPSLQKRIWYLPEHNIWFSSGVKEDHAQFYYINELDVEFEIKNSKMMTYYNAGHCYRDSYCKISEHRDEIYDVIEIQKPYLILTACMDGNIRLININDKEFIKVWSNHTLGVRHLSYNPNIDTVGHILSSGFEYYINLYSTDLSLDEAYKGRLEGHYAPVMTCRFLGNSHMCISVDEESSVRIWDCRLRLCLQMIPMMKKNFQINNLFFIQKHNIFLLYGNKMLFYESKYKNDEIQIDPIQKEENYPIQTEFNHYYSQFFVVTMKDIRVYNKEGEMIKLFKKCRENEHFEPDTKIKSFRFENNYRKFYVGFSNGAVMQYNAGNGSLIKTINEHEIEKEGLRIYQYDHSKEIISMHYFYHLPKEKESSTKDGTKETKEKDIAVKEAFILLTTSTDSLINMYDEINPEETEKLKTLKGGHTINGHTYEILTMDFSRHLNLIATGSSGGLTVVWEFEMAKVENAFYINPAVHDKVDVVSVKFMDPFPLICICYSDGICSFWNIKTVFKEGGSNQFRYRNYYSTLYRIETAPITCMSFIMKEMEDIKASFKFKKFFTDEEEDIKLRNQRIKDELTGEYLPEIIIDKDYLEDILDVDIDPESQAADNWRYYFITGDTKGYMKVLNFKGFLLSYSGKRKNITIKSNFNLLKKEDVNVETVIHHILLKKKDLADITNLYKSKVMVREWKAHDEAITSMEYVKEPFAIITIGKDCMMRVWNEQCECIGEINVLPKMKKNITLKLTSSWKFKIDEQQILANDIQEVVRLLEDAQVPPIVEGSEQDDLVHNIDTEIVQSQPEEVKKKPIEQKIKKQRFKELLSNRKNSFQYEECEVKGNTSYEDVYVQDAQKKIEELITVQGPKEGISQMSNMIISTATQPKENKKKKIIALDKSEKNLQKFASTQNIFLKTNKSFYKQTIPTNPQFRDTFYAKHLLSKNRDDTKLRKDLMLPLLKYDYTKDNEKKSLAKKSADKLLAYEFYKSSYRSTCSINPSTNTTNQSLTLNFKNQWKMVDKYNNKFKQSLEEKAKIKIAKSSSQKDILPKETTIKQSRVRSSTVRNTMNTNKSYIP